MNKNPFLPTPSFTPQQPPLPPGPPPPQPSQPDYSTWWANATAAQPHVQPPTVGPYNTQWTPPQPPRPSAEQSALYANYGYGSQNNHWQRQQQQYHPPPPVIQQPPHPPTQPGYNPYQPSAGYPQQYVPQPGPPPQQMVHPSYPHPPVQPQHFFSPAIPPQPQHHQQLQQSQPRHIHHTPSQHLPPAKRQRFDGPNNNNRHHQNQPPQPQFQPPPAPPQNLSHGPSRGGVPSGPGGRGGGPTGPRGGGVGARGRGASMTGNRGGLSAGRGRGGGSFVGGGGSRGGGLSNGPLRGHGSRNNFGGGNKDFHNRRGGGSFTGSGGGTGYSHQGGSSFRGRNQGHVSSNRGNRSDGGSGPVFGSREGTMSSSFGGKKDENRRTLTDFKIVGLEIPDLSWTWGIIPSLSPVKAEENAINVDGQGTSSTIVKEEILDDSSTMHAVTPSNSVKETLTEVKSDVSVQSTEIEMVDAKPLQDTMSNARVSSDNVPPPSRIRIYFHTPVTADDARPIPHSSSYGDIPSDSRKGKRKKLEDDDGDLEEHRVPPPPPQMGGAMNDDQLSVTASVAETVSEGDWLMAAIVEGEEEAGGAAGDLPSEDDEESDQLHVSQIIKDHDHDDSIDDDVTVGDVETSIDGNNSHDDVHMAGAELDALGSSAVFGTTDDNPKVAEATTENVLLATSSQMSTLGHINGGHTTDANAVADDPEHPEMVALDSTVAIMPLEPEVHISSVSASLISSSQHDVVSPESADDYSADHPEYLETQVFEASSQNLMSKSLETVSADPTLLNMDEATQSDESALNNLNGVEPYSSQATNDASDVAGTTSQGDHLPEPPASPSDDASSLRLVKVDTGAVKTPSANRLSISYSRGIRRFVIDAEVVESVNLFRQEGRIEVTMNIDKNTDGSLKGILMEGLSDLTKSYLPLLTDPEVSPPDITVPPFSKVHVPSALKLVVYLDTARPLSEPKWAKTGDVQDWLKSMFGRMFWVAGEAAEGWERKIHVVDPDPPPTIWTVLDAWSTNSPVGVLNERQRFLKTHMTETDNILEILLRLVRGERATPFSQSAPAISAPSVSGPLLSALSQGSAHGSQQTHVSLAVLAMFRLTVDYAKKALGDKGKGEAEECIGEIIRCLPSHLVYKSLDGIFREWRVEKKGR